MKPSPTLLWPARFLLLPLLLLFNPCRGATGQTETTVFPGADEKTPSRSEYFSWINNTNEGATEEHTRINLEFFQWLRSEYGMVLDIYAFDAGAIDGKRFCGKMNSDRFRRQFPRGFQPLADLASAMNTRLGLWGGPDGFGNTRQEEADRTEMMVSLCRDLNFALFKFDAVCGPLRPEKEDAFVRMMTECRVHCPDLIVLNHRLGLEKAKAHATTFLWEGKETYIDVWSTNSSPAPHHRADALSRGLVPDLQRLTEDHGVCISSCLDFWEDDLVLQAFNRGLILAPQIYGNPWLLRDDEFPRLARLFNLHRRYRDILVEGMVLPEEEFGPAAVSRGDDSTRLLTLRNLTWDPVTIDIPLDQRIGLTSKVPVHCRQLHPSERNLGDANPGMTKTVTIAPFRASLFLFSTKKQKDLVLEGCDYEVVRDVPSHSVLIDLKGLPGTRESILLQGTSNGFIRASLDGKEVNGLLRGDPIDIHFQGDPLTPPFHRKLGELNRCPIPGDAEALYEATVFAADNNALEVRSLSRSGKSKIPQVQRARTAFFEQPVFTNRGIWDRNLFDDDLTTGFFPTRKYRIDQRVQGGCLRLDLGKIQDLDLLSVTVPDSYSLQPLLEDEAYHVDVSTDLATWTRISFLAGTTMEIPVGAPVRYVRFRHFPDRVTEIRGFKDGEALERKDWRASNLFAPSSRKKPVQAWSQEVTLNEWVPGSTLCIAIHGKHGVEGAYAALRFEEEQPVGCPDRAPSFPSNTWEYVNAKRDSGYTYYIPVTQEMIGRPFEAFVLGYDKNHVDLKPAIWITTKGTPFKTKRLELQRRKEN